MQQTLRRKEIRFRFTYSQKKYSYNLEAHSKAIRTDNHYINIRNKKSKNTQKDTHEKTVVILYHKPANVVTTHASEIHLNKVEESKQQPRKNVYEDIASMENYVSNKESKNSRSISTNQIRSFSQVTGIDISKFHAIGRLDAATTGALLLTNDGMLVHYITNPNANVVINENRSKNEKGGKIKKSIIKTYTALIMGYHDDHSPIITQIRKGGILIPGSSTPTLPVPFINVLSHPTPKTTLIQMGLTEGKNRHIRKLFHTLKSGVMRLHRDAVGNVNLKDYNLNEEGTWMVLSENDVWEKLGWKTRTMENDSQVNGAHPSSRSKSKRRRRVKTNK